MTEDEIREAVSDPTCPFTYEELWDMFFGPPGPSISDILDQLEAEFRQAGVSATDPPPASRGST